MQWYSWLEQHGAHKSEEIELVPSVKELEQMDIKYYIVEQQVGQMVVNTHSAPHWVFAPVSVLVLMQFCVTNSCFTQHGGATLSYNLGWWNEKAVKAFMSNSTGKHSSLLTEMLPLKVYAFESADDTDWLFTLPKQLHDVLLPYLEDIVVTVKSWRITCKNKVCIGSNSYN